MSNIIHFIYDCLDFPFPSFPSIFFLIIYITHVLFLMRCPIHFFFLFLIVVHTDHFMFIFRHISSFGTHSVQEIFNTLHQHQVSNVSIFFLSAFSNIHNSAPYNVTFHTIVFISFFLIFMFILFVVNIFFLFE